MQQVKDTISAVKETLGMAQRADKTDVELTAETATATPIDTPACANPANATDLFDKAKEEVHAAAEEAHIAQVKACEAATVAQSATAVEAAALEAKRRAEQELQDAAKQAQHLEKQGPLGEAEEAARRLADVRGEVFEAEKARDVLLHDAKQLEEPAKNASKQARELETEAASAKAEAQKLSHAVHKTLESAANIHPPRHNAEKIADAEKQLEAALADAQELETVAEDKMRQAETQAGLAKELFGLAAEYSAKYWQAKDRGAAAETKAVALADEAEGLAKKADDAHGRVVILQTTVQALRGEAAHVVEEQRKRAEAAKAPMQQAKELLSVAQEKQQAAAAMRARAAKLGEAVRARQQEAHQVEASVSRKEAEAHALEEKLTSLRAEVDRAKQAVAEKRDKAEQQLRDAERRLQEANAANEHWKTVQAEAQAARDKEHAAWKRAVEYGEDASQQADQAVEAAAVKVAETTQRAIVAADETAQQADSTAQQASATPAE